MWSGVGFRSFIFCLIVGSGQSGPKVAPLVAPLVEPVVSGELIVSLPEGHAEGRGLLLEPGETALVKVGLANRGTVPVTPPDDWLKHLEVELLRGASRLSRWNEREDPEFAARLRSSMADRAVKDALVVVRQDRGGTAEPGSGVSADLRLTGPEPGEYQLYAWIPPSTFPGLTFPGERRDGRISDPLLVVVEKTISPEKRSEILSWQARRLATRDDPSALRAVDEAIALQPENGELHRVRGFVLDRLGRREEALSAFQEALRLYREGKVSPKYIGWEKQIHWIERSVQALAEGRPVPF
jgi:hypothetical protein